MLLLLLVSLPPTLMEIGTEGENDRLLLTASPGGDESELGLLLSPVRPRAE